MSSKNEILRNWLVNVSDTLLKERSIYHGIEEGSKDMEATETPREAMREFQSVRNGLKPREGIFKNQERIFSE